MARRPRARESHGGVMHHEPLSGVKLCKLADLADDCPIICHLVIELQLSSARGAARRHVRSGRQHEHRYRPHGNG
jgi:hypothetical protein